MRLGTLTVAVRDLLMREDLPLTPSEEKIVRLLLAEYPTSGLGTATSLARRAGVSDPTVVRLVMKLGFSGFPDFQAKLLAEVEARLHSPLLMMESKRAPKASGSPILTYLRSVGEAIEKAQTSAPLQSYDRAARLVMGAKGDVLTLGGRFSRHIASMFAGHLVQLRRGVCDIDVVSAQTFDILAEIGGRDVLVAFDYRRYQSDVVAFARQASGRGARVVLFTDPWQSPIAAFAEVTIVSPVEAASPYDTMAPAVAQMEALVARIVATADGGTRDRIERLEEVRRQNAVTVDDADADADAARSSPRKTRKDRST